MFGGTSAYGSTSGYPTDEENPDRRLQHIHSSYDPNHVNCRFRLMFYNKVNPSEVHKYRPPPTVNPRLWNQAVVNNPDPRNLVPVQVTGFEDLKKRLDAQEVANAEYQKKLKEIKSTLAEMQRQQELTRKQEIEKLRKSLADQSARLLKVMTKVECERARDLPLLSTEVDFRRKLEAIKRKLARPLARVTELQGVVRLQEERPPDALLAINLDPDTAGQLYQFLDTQRVSLQHVMNTSRRSNRDAQIIVDGLQTALKTNR